MLANQDNQTTTKKPWDRISQLNIPTKLSKTLESIEKDASAFLEIRRQMARISRHGVPTSAIPVSIPLLKDVVNHNDPSLTNTILLGICDDCIPLTLDLTNPAPGSVLIAGDPGCGKTNLLNAVLSSAVLINPPDKVRFNLIARDLTNYTTVSNAENCDKAITHDHSSAGFIIRELMAETDRRRLQPTASITILAIDDLARLLHFLNDHEFFQLYRLIKHGPRHRIWTIATLSTRYVEYIDLHILEAFRTHMLGHIDDARIEEKLSRIAQIYAAQLQSGEEFCIPIGADWTNIWICHPESESLDEQPSDQLPVTDTENSLPQG